MSQILTTTSIHPSTPSTTAPPFPSFSIPGADPGNLVTPATRSANVGSASPEVSPTATPPLLPKFTRLKPVHLFAPFDPATITRRDDGTMILDGYAFVNEDCGDGWILSRRAMIAASADYMRWGALREMHGLSAAGTALSVEWDAGGARIRAYVVDRYAIEKVEKGVYKGFSVGVMPVAVSGNVCTEVQWIETSLVDRPKDPDAVFTLVRTAGAAAMDDLVEVRVVEPVAVPVAVEPPVSDPTPAIGAAAAPPVDPTIVRVEEGVLMVPPMVGGDIPPAGTGATAPSVAPTPAAPVTAVPPVAPEASTPLDRAAATETTPSVAPGPADSAPVVLSSSASAGAPAEPAAPVPAGELDAPAQNAPGEPQAPADPPGDRSSVVADSMIETLTAAVSRIESAVATLAGVVEQQGRAAAIAEEARTQAIRNAAAPVMTTGGPLTGNPAGTPGSAVPAGPTPVRYPRSVDRDQFAIREDPGTDDLRKRYDQALELARSESDPSKKLYALGAVNRLKSELAAYGVSV